METAKSCENIGVVLMGYFNLPNIDRVSYYAKGWDGVEFVKKFVKKTPLINI